jgi:hypothetical protein
MTPAQQISLAPVWTGSGFVFTLPPQLQPFRLEAIHWRFVWNGGAHPSTNNFIKVEYGGGNVIWQVANTSSAATGVYNVVTASPGVGSVEVINPAGLNPGYVTLFPLPSLILNELAQVTFGIIGGIVTDVADQGSVMISYPQSATVPWWLRGRRKKV